MNRQQRRAAEKTMGKDTLKRVNLILSLPEKCLTCEAKFDKKSKEHAATWHVEVFSEQRRVDLYCPECQASLNKRR
jgi:hypothetical protein